MAAASTKVSVWVISCVVVFLFVHVVTSSAEGENGSLACVDGTYDHEGKVCCLCGAGQHLNVHCTASQQYGKCDHCATNMFNSQPNYQMYCDPCTSCSQPNANLEVKESCTPASDAKCQCKKDHYCSSGTETCMLCNPCKECPEGIKVACTSNNNTVCNEKIEGVHNIGIIIGIVAILSIGLGIVFFCCWKRRQNRAQSSAREEEEMRPIATPVVDLQPYLPDIAEIIGWKDMKDIAMRSRITSTIIESCQLDFPNDSKEQTIKLLTIWVEKQGREASKNLIQNLKNSSKVEKAQKVFDMLTSARVCPL